MTKGDASCVAKASDMVESGITDINGARALPRHSSSLRVVRVAT